MMEIIELIYGVISIIVGWKLCTWVQEKSNLIVFAQIGEYIIAKFVLSFVIGLVVTPFYVIYKVIKLFINRKQQE